MSHEKIRDIVKKLLNGKNIDDIFDSNDSQNGFIFEAIYKILSIDKNITSIPIKYSKIFNCQMSEITKSYEILNIKTIFDQNVFNASGGKSDFNFKHKECYIFTSIKCKGKFIPGESDIEKINNEASNDLELNESEYNL